MKGFTGKTRKKRPLFGKGITPKTTQQKTTNEQPRPDDILVWDNEPDDQPRPENNLNTIEPPKGKTSKKKTSEQKLHESYNEAQDLIKFLEEIKKDEPRRAIAAGKVGTLGKGPKKTRSWNLEEKKIITWFIDAHKGNKLPNQKDGIVLELPDGCEFGSFQLNPWIIIPAPIEKFYSRLLIECKKDGPSYNTFFNELAGLRSRAEGNPVKHGQW